MDEERQTFSGPAIIELMGHNVIAGEASEQTIAGAAFLRVDVPAIGTQPAFTKFFSAAAVYAITPTDAATVSRAAEHLAVRPISVWTVPDGRRELPAPTLDQEDMAGPYKEAWDRMDEEMDEVDDAEGEDEFEIGPDPAEIDFS